MSRKHQRGSPVRLLHNLFHCAVVITLAASILNAQSDPGPRGGPAGAGGPLPMLDSGEQQFFNAARLVFQEVDSVSGTLPGAEGKGLGPTFNADSCAACHAQPAAGGSSPATNPQIAIATKAGAHNTIPPFITANGPVREARFISTNPSNPAAPLDGGVHGVFTIAGRSDAPGCTLAQPDFAAQLANHNVIFRIPTPTFGLGLVENTADATLQANLAANATQKALLGIGGKLNMSGNDGTVTRFGWKAQNKSLMVFAGEAYNVEQGVANEVFMNERSAVAGCVFNATPEDSTPMTGGSSDVTNFATFMRLSAPPAPVPFTASAQNGSNLFNLIGCALCHTPSLTTAKSPYTGASNMTYHPYSDFAVHHMGANLADGVNQGAAGPDEFRTAPLWGAGQRLFFLHDGRTSDLLQAIREHSSPGFSCVVNQNFLQFQANGAAFLPYSQAQFCGSEANGVIALFNALGASQKQDILNFLRSL